jgi:5-methyltetrahydrofolate--homocysteine methyltransferase
MRTTIEAFKEAGVRDGVKLIIGGAPVTRHYAEQIGADGYSESAAAVTLARSLMAGN